ncbi:MAG: hypothetical protein ACOX9B_12280 [Candidatus Xenobium sp.]|jgi:hypothetical protein|nr:hypothetical protein [Burkholderiales bacterium]
MTLGMAATLSVLFFAAAIFAVLRHQATKKNKVWTVAGIIAACLCLLGLAYVAATLLLVTAVD